jgi:hypothetical protein
MKRLFAISWLVLFCGCTAVHSPYDMRDVCVRLGSTRLGSVGPQASDPAKCDQELNEDLADNTPRLLYIPRDIAMAPVMTARFFWGLLGGTQPPF